ncbi:MAG TPA: AAA family ATPase [Acidimicrobiia bacterium]|nr:AAA family ATPase [Acidimicrobiia bacterium]
MTAPLRTPALRVLVLDRTGELAARLRQHVAGIDAVVRACRNAGQAEAELSAAPWDVVVAGPSLMHPAGLGRLAALHVRMPWVATVLALHERPRADLAQILQVGASDLVPLHAEDDELWEALQRAARITRVRLGIMAGRRRAALQGRTIMVASASGGSGKTFLATNAAEFLARTVDRPVVLVDLDLQFGEVSTALRLRPDRTITDALAAEAEGHDLEAILDDYLLLHPDGFKVLAAPRLPAEADSVNPGDVTRLLDVLRHRGAWVVIDMHEGLSDLFTAALDAADHIFAVATPDRPSLVSLERYLAMLERLGMSSDRISVVLNKAEADRDVPAGYVTIPYSRDVSRSANVGVPLIVGKPKSPIGKILTQALSTVLSEPPRERREPVPPPADVPVQDRDHLDVPAEPSDEIDLTEPAPLPEPLLIDSRPAEIRLVVTTTCRGRGPPCPLSPRLHTSLVPSLVTK